LYFFYHVKLRFSHFPYILYPERPYILNVYYTLIGKSIYLVVINPEPAVNSFNGSVEELMYYT